jgi:hypothetical protein
MVKSEVLWKLIPIQKTADTRVENLVPAPITGQQAVEVWHNWYKACTTTTLSPLPVLAEKPTLDGAAQNTAQQRPKSACVCTTKACTIWI